jgi:hypothetical protein
MAAVAVAVAVGWLAVDATRSNEEDRALLFILSISISLSLSLVHIHIPIPVGWLAASELPQQRQFAAVVRSVCTVCTHARLSSASPSRHSLDCLLSAQRSRPTHAHRAASSRSAADRRRHRVARAPRSTRGSSEPQRSHRHPRHRF